MTVGQKRWRREPIRPQAVYDYSVQCSRRMSGEKWASPSTMGCSRGPEGGCCAQKPAWMESEPVGISGGGIDPEDRRGTKLTRATTAPRLKGLGAASDASDATDPEMPDLIEADSQASGGAESSGDGLSHEAMGEDANRGQEMEDEEEGRPPIVMRAPFRVSKEEREAHEITHSPYRAWCPHCVRARGRNTPHKSRDEAQKTSGVPRISMDYFFMSSADESASANPMLVMMDESTGEKYARAVGHKGLGRDGEADWLVKDLSEEVKTWGHMGGEGGHILLKTDGERAITAVRDALARYHGCKVVPESPPRGESRSNGAIEEAGKTVREYVRVLKEQVEHYCQIKLETAENLTLWMIRWAAMLCSRYLVGKDGLTAYQRRRGRNCLVPTAMFAEKVWYKELRQTKERQDKFDSEWREGIWLGHSRNSNEHLVGTTDGVIRAYSVKRQSPDQRWCPELVRGMKGTPQQPDPLKPGIAVPIRINFDPPAAPPPVLADVGSRRRWSRTSWGGRSRPTRRRGSVTGLRNKLRGQTRGSPRGTKRNSVGNQQA